MKKLLLVSLSMILLVAFFGGSAAPATAKEPKLLEFDTMVGVPVGLKGGVAAPLFRGLNGGGLAWTLTSAKGELKASGELEVEVQGLVFAEGANTGKNTVTSFRAVVSCIKSDGSIENIQTGLFPATIGPASEGGGNANIETMVSLPQPCFAPIVFITSPGGAWFAVTGN